MSLAQRLLPERRRGPWASGLHQGRDHILGSQAILITMHMTPSGRKEMYVFLLLLMRRHLSHETCIQFRYKHFEWQYFFPEIRIRISASNTISSNSEFPEVIFDKAIRTMGAPVFSKKKQYLCHFNCSEHWVYMIQTNICEWISKYKQWKHNNQTDSF